MKTKTIVLGFIGFLLVAAVILFFKYQGWRNELITLEEQVKSSWSQVDIQLQRRIDLIPNLVETVKGYAAHEKEVLIGVTEARSKVAGAGNIGDKIKANNELTSALSRLMVVVEKYPDLKANQNFLALQDELAGTENRISVERGRYNETAQLFNQKRRHFPYYMIADSLNLKEAPYFEAAAGAKEVPKIKF